MAPVRSCEASLVPAWTRLASGRADDDDDDRRREKKEKEKKKEKKEKEKEKEKKEKEKEGKRRKKKKKKKEEEERTYVQIICSCLEFWKLGKVHTKDSIYYNKKHGKLHMEITCVLRCLGWARFL